MKEQVISTVFATGEAETAERAFERAHTLLWKRLGALDDLELMAVEHKMQTRTVSEKSLNLKDFTTEIYGELSTVIISLLATCKYMPADETTETSDPQGEPKHARN